MTKTLETRKLPKLARPRSLETLTVIAYYQPATKALVEQIRGVDSAYCVSALVTKKPSSASAAGSPNALPAPPSSMDDAGLARVRSGILADLPQIGRSTFMSTCRRSNPIGRSRMRRRRKTSCLRSRRSRL